MAEPARSLNLTAFAPDRCHAGHLLGPGRILVGWQTCNCLATQEAGTRGHTTVRCLVCDLDGVETVYTGPECERATPRP